MGSVITAAAQIAERHDLIWWELRSLRNVTSADVVDLSEVATRTSRVNGEIREYNQMAERLVETLEATLRTHLLKRGAPVTER